MRPDPEEILRGLGRLLSQTLLPELTSPYARSQLMSALLLLEHAASRVGEVERFRRAERGDLLETAAAAERELRGSAGGACSELCERLAAAREKAAEGAEAAVDELRQALSDVVREMLFSPAAGRRLQELLRRYLERRVARDREWVRVGEVTW